MNYGKIILRFIVLLLFFILFSKGIFLFNVGTLFADDGSSSVVECVPQAGGTVPPLRLQKDSDRHEVSPGSLVNYQIIIQNPDSSLPCADPNNIFNKIGVTDKLSSNVTLQGTPSQSSGTAAASGNTITWQGEVTRSAIITIAYQVKVSENAPDGPIANSAVLFEMANPVTPSTSLALTATNTIIVRSRWDIWMPLIARSKLPLPQFKNPNFDIIPDQAWNKRSVKLNPDSLITCPDAPIFGTVNPLSPRCLAWLGGYPDEISNISQTLSIPDGYRQLFLKFNYLMRSVDSSCNDKAALYVNNDSPRWTLDMCTKNDSSDWLSQSIDISNLARNVPTVFKFETTQDGSGNSHLFLDNMLLCTTDSDVASEAQCVAINK